VWADDQVIVRSSWVTMPLSRRHFIGAGFGLVAGGVAAACQSGGPSRRSRTPRPAGRWSNPATWGGAVPRRGAHVVVDRAVLLDVDAEVASLTISPVGTLAFDPEGGRTLESEGNVVVHGRLAMRPATATAEHRLVFRGVDERRFAGGGMDPLDSDVGLWVMGAGVLDAAGTPKRAWSRLAEPARFGTSSITVADPSGWQAGDEIVVTPTEAPSVPEHHLRHDRRRIASISGTEIELDTPLDFPHPAVEVAPGHTMRAEVLNLTRNVRIEGTPDGRAHVFIRAGRQTISHVELAHVGPRQPTPDPQADSQKVLGRYGLHFHHCGDGSSGSTVEGCVIRDAGNHAFVPHTSHGIAFRDCISHDTIEKPYWWDESEITDDTLFERCVASRSRHDPDSRGYGHEAFLFGAGEGNRARDCVASGISGGFGGFGWDALHPQSVWPEASGLVAHNINGPGIKVWQNNFECHHIRGFVSYHNSGAGIEHGAYGNNYLYEDGICYGNGASPIDVHASFTAPRSDDNGKVCDQRQPYRRIHCDGGGRAEYGIQFGPTPGGASDDGQPVLIEECTFAGTTRANVGMVGPGSDTPILVDALRNTYGGNAFWLNSDVPAGSQIKVDDPTHRRVTLRAAGQPGTPNAEWNASVESP
jgi:hypothetical protein